MLPFAVIYIRSNQAFNPFIFAYKHFSYLFGALLTFIYLYCAPCCGCVGGQQLTHVYDPDLPDQEFVFRGGKVIRKDEDIIEMDEK